MLRKYVLVGVNKWGCEVKREWVSIKQQRALGMHASGMDACTWEGFVKQRGWMIIVTEGGNGGRGGK